jgi:hypothetical protein
VKVEDVIREAHKLYDIRNLLGLKTRQRWIVCPLPDHVHSSNTPSFSVFTDGDGIQRFKCHGNCGAYGDVIDLAGYLYVAGYDRDNPEHIRMALSYLDLEADIDPPPPPVRPKPIKPTLWKSYFPPGQEVVAYGRKRGLEPETLEHFRVGQFKHFMAMPTFHDGMLQGIKFRNTDPDPMPCHHPLDGLRFWAAKGSQKGLFNYDAVAYTQKPVLVLKGEIPVMLARQSGFLACAPTGGEGSYIQELAYLFSFANRVVVVGDNDQDPQVREKMQAKAQERAEMLHAALRFPPQEYKDIDEWMLAEPVTALLDIERWLGGH